MRRSLQVLLKSKVRARKSLHPSHPCACLASRQRKEKAWFPRLSWPRLFSGLTVLLACHCLLSPPACEAEGKEFTSVYGFGRTQQGPSSLSSVLAQSPEPSPRLLGGRLPSSLCWCHPHQGLVTWYSTHHHTGPPLLPSTAHTISTNDRAQHARGA